MSVSKLFGRFFPIYSQAEKVSGRFMKLCLERLLVRKRSLLFGEYRMEK
jgi:hypothetical protein